MLVAALVANSIYESGSRVTSGAKRYWTKVITDVRMLNIERATIVHGHWCGRIEAGVDVPRGRPGDKLVILRQYKHPADLQRAVDMAKRLNEYIVMKFPSKTPVKLRGNRFDD